ncbi:hypothetical protein DPMN_092785 [Dreissena polymorpha]|uniref:Peptidase aspartic putative domain-containing protein n=1 Tax=Dreissena polymorpha TaxID=45954 RepID=A0A9D4L303_DREPO|nr:hypothetical protein DPMN_092785 [Dreissena polymorpha]
MELTKNLHLADSTPMETESDVLELLVGNDFYLDVIEPEKKHLNPGLYLLSSTFGWMVSGRTELDDIDNSEDVNMLILTHGNSIRDNSKFSEVDDLLPMKPNIEDFWNIEGNGITDDPMKTDDEKAMEHF